jgi:pilus assembly protein CpaB
MNRNRLMVGLAIAVFAGLLLSMFVYHEFKIASSPAPTIQMQQIVVAAGPMPLGTRLTEKDLRVIPWPATSPLTNVFTKPEDCVNRALITSVAENEPILQSKLAPVAAGAGLAATLPEGMRALSVAVNDVVAVAGFVTPGSMVDVLSTGSTGGNGNITITVLENVRVLAANQRIESNGGKPVAVAVITLMVAPQDAAKLAMASSAGKIQLALRNTIDSQTSEIAPVLQASLFGNTPPPQERRPSVAAPKPSVVAPPPSTGYVVDIISGGKRENKTFPNAEPTTGESNGQPAQNH